MILCISYNYSHAPWFGLPYLCPVTFRSTYLKYFSLSNFKDSPQQTIRKRKPPRLFSGAWYSLIKSEIIYTPSILQCKARKICEKRANYYQSRPALWIIIDSSGERSWNSRHLSQMTVWRLSMNSNESYKLVITRQRHKYWANAEKRIS